MKERPIIFSAPMVRALLEGRKSQTRRLVKPQPECVDGATWRADGLSWAPCRDELSRGILDQIGPAIRCPHGATGDRLWTKETWAPADRWADGFEREDPTCVRYRADGAAIRFEGDVPIPLDAYAWSEPPAWRSPIYMPRWASRITLEIVDVRVERLQSITDEDAMAEGISPGDGAWHDGPDGKYFADKCGWYIDHVRHNAPSHAFRALWDSLHGKRAPWSSSPWVWVLTFKRVEESK